MQFDSGVMMHAHTDELRSIYRLYEEDGPSVVKTYTQSSSETALTCMSLSAMACTRALTSGELLFIRCMPDRWRGLMEHHTCNMLVFRVVQFKIEITKHVRARAVSNNTWRWLWPSG